MSKRKRDELEEKVEAAPEEQKETPPPFGMGYLDPAHDRSRDWNASARFGAVQGLPSSALGLRDFVRRVSDQGATSSCVGQALARAIDVRLKKLGFNGPEPGGMALYTGGRQVEGGQLLDIGSRVHDLLKYARDVGVPRESVWPLDPSKVNVPLPWHVHQDASRFLLFRWWYILASGMQRSDAIAQALSNNFPVIFALQLDKAFFAYRGGTIMNVGPDKAGGHMMCILGYRTREDGSREFLVINSWGTAWGEGGFCWIHEDVLASSRAGEFVVIEVSP